MKYHDNYKIVSFYTPDYREHADGLIASIEKHLPGIKYEVDAISDMAWEKATCLKGHFVWNKLRSSDRPVVWIDADAVVKTPDLQFPNVDFAIYARFADPVRHSWSPFRTGTVYFGNTEDGLYLARSWKIACISRIDGIDQWALFQAWRGSLIDEVYPSTVWLPLPYCQKINEPGEAKIMHSMASRTLRRKK